MDRRQLILQHHQFRNGNLVSVSSRDTPDKVYHGIIYNIVNKQENAYDKWSPYVDYFYISFEKTVYDSLLQRGWKVIYNRKEITLGNVERNAAGEITNIFKQYDFSSSTEEPEIQLENINAILIWRVKFSIE